MRWHSEHGMEHMWAPKDSPAAGATRYGHSLTRCTREKTGRRTRLWRCISGKIVELMSWKFQESSSSRDGDVITSRFSPKVRLGWLAPPALRLALRYICMQSRSLCQVHSLPTWRHPCFRVERRDPAAKVSWAISVRVGCSFAWKFEMDTNSSKWNERPRVVSFHCNRSNTVEKG